MIITEAQKFWLESDFVLELLKQIPAYIFWKDRNSVYLGCNNAFAYSLGLSSPIEIVGKTDYDLPTAKEESDSFRANDKQVIESKQPKLNIEEYQTLPDGRKVALLTNKVPLLDKQKNVIGILGIYNDITDRKNYEKELKDTLSKLNEALKSAEKANQSKSLFLSIMSHELKNYIGNTLTATKLLEKFLAAENIRNDDIKRCLAICEESAEGILPFMDNVIAYFELDSGDIYSKRSPTNILDTIQSMVKNLKSEINAGVKVFLDITASLPKEILVDNLNLYKVLKIVLSNAARFTQKGTISISAALKDNHLIIDVEDTGQGIPEGQLNNIFNAFPEFGRENARYMKFGLKLSLAKKMLELVGGDIQISSEAERGTKVTISLPCQSIEHKPVELKADLVTSGEIIKKILLVEDEVRSLEMAKELLSSLGYQVSTANCGLEAIEKARTEDFDLIFMDITLPDITGLDAAQEIHRHSAKNIPIVAVTSHSSEDAMDDLLAKGMLSVIPKPISLERFEQFFRDLPGLRASD